MKTTTGGLSASRLRIGSLELSKSPDCPAFTGIRGRGVDKIPYPARVGTEWYGVAVAGQSGSRDPLETHRMLPAGLPVGSLAAGRAPPFAHS